MSSFAYPEAARVGVYTSFGDRQAVDFYQWMEAPQDDLNQWVGAQKKLSDLVLRGVDTGDGSLGDPERQNVFASARAIAEEMFGYERISNLVFRNGLYFFLRTSGSPKEHQAKLCVTRSLKGWQKARVLLDPNLWSDDGTVSIKEYSVSPDGKTLAYAVAHKGRNHVSWQMVDVKSGHPLSARSDVEPVWAGNWPGYFFSRNPTVKVVADSNHGTADVKVIPKAFYYYRSFGWAQEEEFCMGEIPVTDERCPYLQVRGGGKYIISLLHEGSSSTPARMGINNTNKREQPGVFLFDGRYCLLKQWLVVDDTLIVNTDDGADLGKVLTFDLKDLSAIPPPVELIAPASDYLNSITVQDGHLVAHYTWGNQNRLEIFDLQGKHLRSVALPTAAHDSEQALFVQKVANGPKGRMLVTLSSMVQPNTVYMLDLSTGKMSLCVMPRVPLLVNAAGEKIEVQITEVLVPSKNGALVPLSLMYRKGIVLDGSHPLVLAGYGGFRSSFQGANSTFGNTVVRAGGIYAWAGIRGGREWGEDWHRQSLRDLRSNSYADFIACAEWLIAGGYTRKDRLAIYGGSNGGLLVASCMLLRPDLFAAVIGDVGVYDLVRHHLIDHVGWSEDFGISTDVDQFESVLARSPLHSVKPADLPAVLITTSDSDQTVNRLHSYKFAAALQYCQQSDRSDRPILFTMRSRAGHGHGASVKQNIDTLAERLAFLALAFGEGSFSFC